jgi:hypothetical protein
MEWGMRRTDSGQTGSAAQDSGRDARTEYLSAHSVVIFMESPLPTKSTRIETSGRVCHSAENVG